MIWDLNKRFLIKRIILTQKLEICLFLYCDDYTSYLEVYFKKIHLEYIFYIQFKSISDHYLKCI